MKPRKETREKILVLLNNTDILWGFQRRGVRRYCNLRGWDFVESKVGSRLSSLRQIVDSVKPVGIISALWCQIRNQLPPGFPVVYFDCPSSIVPPFAPHIRHDARATAHLAARELTALKCRAYAYVSFCEPAEWSNERERFFAEEILRRGGTFLPTFCPPETRKLEILVPAFKDWLRGVPRRCGVFCANDKMAEAVVLAANELGIPIPADIAVVGVDNEEDRCLGCSPSITSIAPDWEGCGFRACSALDDLLRGKVDPAHHFFIPLGIARRESTGRQLVKTDPMVIQAVSMIHEHACEGLRAEDVLRSMHCSRRLAEMRFRESTGSIILEEIRRVRFESARALLGRTSSSVESIANRCGYASVATFCREFRRETDMTPEAWRRKAKSAATAPMFL